MRYMGLDFIVIIYDSIIMSVYQRKYHPQKESNKHYYQLYSLTEKLRSQISYDYLIQEHLQLRSYRGFYLSNLFRSGINGRQPLFHFFQF